MWKLLILLQEVVDIIYASKFTKPMLKYFEELYVEFMTNFVPLCVSIRPKMNFIVHLPSIIRKNGAPENSSVLNYEGWMASLKNPHTRWIITATPVKPYKRQCGALHSLISRGMINEKISYGMLYRAAIEDLPEKCREINLLALKNLSCFHSNYLLMTPNIEKGCLLSLRVLFPLLHGVWENWINCLWRKLPAFDCDTAFKSTVWQ